ncbi:MAG: oligosaccharide flippase family protein [Ignavibacteria bacterium]|nr:oligosaccharide flippase family protein [Ignavibacteria bacterium]
MNSQSFASNALSIAVGQIVSLISSFLSISLTARYLGVEQFGKFNALLAVVLILSKFVDFGFAPVIFRELSKEDNSFDLINVSLTLRVIFFLLTAVLYNLFAFLLKVSFLELLLSNLFFINIIISAKFQNVRELLDIPFKVKLKMHLPSAVSIFDNLLFLLFILLVPATSEKLLFVIVGYVLTNIPGFVLILYLLKKRFGFYLKFSLKNAKWLLIESFPLFGYVILLTVFQQADILLLRYLVSEHSTGIYSAAAKLTLPFGIIPYALITTAIPIIVKKNSLKNSNAPFIINMIYKILFFISFTISIFCTFKAEAIIQIVYGREYLQAAIPMVLLFWSQVLLFFNYFSVDLLTITNCQKFNFIYALIIVAANILLLFLLTPLFSFIGASWAKFFSLLAGSIFFLVVLGYQKIIVLHFNFLRTLLLTCLLGTSAYLLAFLPLVIYFLISCIIIILFTWGTKFFTGEELTQMFKLLNKEKWAKKLRII